MNNKQWFTQDVNAKNMVAINAIKNLNGKYADHMFLQNRIVEAMAKHFEGGIQMLSKPVCPHCEKPGQWHCDFKPLEPNPSQDCVECMELQEEMRKTAGQLIEVHGEITSPEYGHIGCCWCDTHGKSTFAISLKQYLKEQLNVSEEELQQIEKDIGGLENEVNRAG